MESNNILLIQPNVYETVDEADRSELAAWFNASKSALLEIWDNDEDRIYDQFINAEM